MDVLEEYEKFCRKYNIPFKDIKSIKSPDESTLFCSAGMQQFKKDFKSKTSKTIATNQHCIRVEDIDSLGDGIHFADFNMLGLFSFNEWNMAKAVNFWIDFLEVIGLKIDDAHIHPDKKEWSKIYSNLIRVVLDESCKWTDGEIGGYCTEFYINGIEIGNIVNPLGTCIDAGFGLERLDLLVNKKGYVKNKEELLISACLSIIEAGYKPSNKKQGYVLRKLLRELAKISSANIPYLEKEKTRQIILLKKYEKLKLKFPDKDKKWWFETHGIEV